MDAGKFKYVIL